MQLAQPLKDFHKPAHQPSKVVIHWFQLMKQLSQPSKMEAKRSLFQVKELHNFVFRWNCKPSTPDKQFGVKPDPVIVKQDKWMHRSSQLTVQSYQGNNSTEKPGREDRRLKATIRR